MKNGKVVLVFCVLLVLLCGCGAEEPPLPVIEVTATPTPKPTRIVWLTLDGTENGELVLTEINVWKDHENRGAGIVGVGRHGQQVKLVRRSGDGVKIELPSRAQGWVTYYFIKEYK
ncbi:MAG: hypothetical protein GWN93_06155 [Deltaproteobacteria bacterium]|nr:hypothetical protein [Deltaproteobacteria bacterium]